MWAEGKGMTLCSMASETRGYDMDVFPYDRSLVDMDMVFGRALIGVSPVVCAVSPVGELYIHWAGHTPDGCSHTVLSVGFGLSAHMLALLGPTSVSLTFDDILVTDWTYMSRMGTDPSAQVSFDSYSKER